MYPIPHLMTKPTPLTIEQYSLNRGCCTFLAHLMKAVIINWVLISVVAVHFGVAATVSVILNVSFEWEVVSLLSMLFGQFIPSFLIILLSWNFLTLATLDRPRNPTRRLLLDIRAVTIDTYRLASGIFALLTISAFASSFGFLKNNIPLMNPFSWDSTFAYFDRLIHFNIDPHEILMPILGTPLMTTMINAAYHFWFFVLFFIIFVASFDIKNIKNRNTFLIAFFLCFATGGNLLATIFSSAGPVYYSTFGYGEDFEPLLSRLRHFDDISPVWALDVQEMLIDGYQNDGAVKGISAMPSMHVASSVLMALYAFTWRRWAGWLLTGFAFLIMLGSVHLAWHYAIDGYVGALIALICWQISNKVASRSLVWKSNQDIGL